MESSDVFAVVNHPWQPLILATHIVAAPILIVLFGMIFRTHSVLKLKTGESLKRLSGLVSIFCFGVMALSGYCLQVVDSNLAMSIWFWTHLVSGTLFTVVMIFHLLHLFSGKEPTNASLSNKPT